MIVEKNKIYNKNCFELFECLKDSSVDYVFTSPPYNRKRNDKYLFYNDDITNYHDYLFDLIKESLRVSKKHVFINIQTNYYNSSEIYKLIGEYSDYIKNIIVWEKSNPMPANGFNITNSFEYFIVLGTEPLKSNKTYTKNIITTSVNSKMPKEHKAVMKYEVAEWFIENFTKEKDIVLDPNCGIGTTCIACKNNNRQYIGCEISKQYFDMCQTNLAK